MSLRTFNLGVISSGAVSPLVPSSSTLKNWWASENLNSGTSVWVDSGSEGASLTQGFANPVGLGIPIDSKQAIFGSSNNALENATTSISGARESWIVLRPQDLSTQLAFDAVGGTNRNTLFISTNGTVTANVGTSLASAAGAAVEHRPMILRVVVNGDNTGSVYRVADLATASSSPIATGTIGSGAWDGITLGASNTGASGWKGEIAELLRYESVLAGADVTTTATYLLAKYPSCAKFGRTARYVNCVGDSLVEGFASESGYSFKLALFQLFEINDLSPSETLIFRGTLEQRCLDHDGVSGNTIAQIEARVAAAIAANSPDVLVLVAGTNDCQDAGYNGATAEAAMASLAAAVHAADPTLPIVWLLVPPLTNTTHNANATDLNSRLISSVFPMADSTIYPVDVRDAGFTTGVGFTTDGTHFSSLGSAAAASQIAIGIRSAL